MAEHKHAEVLRAIADGKVVQWKAGFTWHDYKPDEDDCSPLIDDGIEWRVKPEPKPDVVQWVCSSDTYSWEAYSCKQSKEFGSFDQIKIVRDGETGKLKSAEIVE